MSVLTCIEVCDIHVHVYVVYSICIVGSETTGTYVTESMVHVCIDIHVHVLQYEPTDTRHCV